MAALTATCPHQHQPTSVHVSNDPTGTGCQCHVPTTDKNCDCRCVILRFCPAACVRSHGLQRRRWIQSWCNVLRTDTVYHQHVHTREFIFGLFVNWINSRRLNKWIIDYSNSRLWIFRSAGMLRISLFALLVFLLLSFISFEPKWVVWCSMWLKTRNDILWSLLFTHPAVTEEHWLNAVCVTWCMWTSLSWWDLDSKVLKLKQQSDKHYEASWSCGKLSAPSDLHHVILLLYTDSLLCIVDIIYWL